MLQASISGRNPTVTGCILLYTPVPLAPPGYDFKCGPFCRCADFSGSGFDLTMDACATKCTKCASSVGFIFAPFASTVAGRTDGRCDGNTLKVGRPPVTEQWYLMVSVCALWCRYHQWPTHHYFWVPMLHYFSSPGHLFAVALLWCGDGPIFRRDCWNQEAFRRLWRTGDLSSGRRLAIGKSTSTIQVASPSQRAPEELCDKCLRSLHRTVESTERKRRVDSGGSGRQFRSHLPDGKQHVTGFNSRTVTGPHGHRFPNSVRVMRSGASVAGPSTTSMSKISRNRKSEQQMPTDSEFSTDSKWQELGGSEQAAWYLQLLDETRPSVALLQSHGLGHRDLLQALGRGIWHRHRERESFRRLHLIVTFARVLARRKQNLQQSFWQWPEKIRNIPRWRNKWMTVDLPVIMCGSKGCFGYSAVKNAQIPSGKVT